MASPTFWDDQTAAQKVVGELARLRNLVAPQLELQKKVEDLNALFELADESDDDPELAAELAAETEKLRRHLDKIEIESFLNGPLDANNAIVTIHAGAGGTESCDWAEMLFRMYLRWAERRGYSVEIEDVQDGEEAGVSKVTFRVIGPNAYGYCKAERGVHRLVRISPFDSNKRRHTSFASVDVIAEVEDDIDLEIKEAAVRSKLVMEAKHICKKFGEREIVKDFSLRVLKGNRIGIVGPNGSGKTTLVKLLTQHLAPDSGFVRLGKNLEMAYFDQNREMLDPDKTLWRTLCGEGDHIYVRGHYRHVIAYLKDFLFTPDQAQSPVSCLSGGEKNLLQIARIARMHADLAGSGVEFPCFG
mgnify:CR=1 FL=1